MFFASLGLLIGASLGLRFLLGRASSCSVPIFADGGYAGPKLATALAGQPVEIEIVRRPDKDGGFKVIRRRWVIERTFSWLRRNRRLMAHYEAIVMVAVDFAKLAMISVMLKRLTEPQHCSIVQTSDSGS